MTPASDRRIVVALLAEDQEFQRLQAREAVEAGERKGFQVELLYAENNAILQIQQLFKVIHAPAAERARAIVVETVVGEGLQRVARAATAAGIGWVLINRAVDYVADLRREHRYLPIGVVSTDQAEIGRIQARQFRALVLSGSGSVLYVQGPPDTSAARLRTEGARAGLAGSAIQLRVLDGRWTEESGEAAMKAWLRLSGQAQPDVIGCQNDAMAVGVRRAIEASPRHAELAAVPLTGCDGLIDGGRRLVQQRKLAATVVTPANTGPAIELLANTLDGGAPFPAERLLMPASFPSEAELQRGGAASPAVAAVQ